MKKIIFLLILPILLFSLENRPIFTQEEVKYLKEHPVLKVGSGDDWAPFNFIDSDGIFKGITKDYLDLLSKKSGLKIELTTGKWNDILGEFKDKKLDLLPAALYTKEREEFGDYLKPHIKLRDFIYAREDDTSINSFEDLSGKTLVRIKGYAVLDPYLPHLKDVKIIEVGSTLEMIGAVHNKKADAFLEGHANINHVLKENMIGGFKSIAQTISRPTTAHMLVKKDSTTLFNIIKKSLESITQNEHNTIYNRWVNLDIEDKSLIKLTREQKEWISEHPTVVVGGEMDWGPFDFVNENGEYRGLANDYLNLITLKTGLKFDVRTGMTWSELLEAMKNKKIDLLPAIFYTKEREQNLLDFTINYLSLSHYFYTRKTEPVINSISELYGKRVAVVKGFSINGWLEKNHPQITLVIKDSLIGALNSVIDQEADAYIGDNASTTYNIQRHFISTLKMDATLKGFNPTDLYMGVRKDYKVLGTIISQVITSITHNERTKIEKKWMTYLDDGSKKINFNKIEREWINSHPLIRVVADPDWRPFEYIDKNSGKLAGMSKSYLDIVERKTGIKFELIPTNTWMESVNKMENREADFIACIRKIESRKEYLNFSIPYLEFPVVIITKNDKQLMTNIQPLYGKKVAFIKGHAITEMVINDHPQIMPVYVNNVKEALISVSKGASFAFISMQEVASYQINKERLFDLKISGKTEYNFPLGMALRNDWGSTGIYIINKALNSISDEEHNRIYNRWVGITYEEQVDYKLVLQVSALFIILIIGTAYWNRKLSRAKDIIETKTDELERQKQFIDSVMDSQQNIVITTDGENIFSANKAFLDFFYVNELSDFKDTNRCICDKFIIDESGEFLQKDMDGTPWMKYVYQHSDEVIKVKMTHDDIEHIFSISAVEILSTSDALVTVVFNDITDLELQKKQLEIILKNLPDPMIITQKSKVVFANPEALKSFQVKTMEDIIGFNAKNLYKSEKDSLDILQLLKTNNSIHNREVQLISPNKKIVDALTSIMKIEYNGEPSLLATYTDITEQKAREAEIHKLHKKITDSIEYASLIQSAIIPSDVVFSKYFSDYFTIWEPKDAVGGDIYLVHEYTKDELILMLIDCTGHGVPGAFVTMLVKAVERQIMANLNKDTFISPSKILSVFNKSIKHLLQQGIKESKSNAGFDGGVIYYNKKEKLIKFSGALSSLFYMQDSQLIKIKGDRCSIGYKDSDVSHQFKEYEIEVKDGMNFYITTDGYTDQNGGEKGFPFGKKKFAEIIKTHYNKSFREQKSVFLEKLDLYQGDEDRNDDITMVGFKI